MRPGPCESSEPCRGPLPHVFSQTDGLPVKLRTATGTPCARGERLQQDRLRSPGTCTGSEDGSFPAGLGTRGLMPGFCLFPLEQRLRIRHTPRADRDGDWSAVRLYFYQIGTQMGLFGGGNRKGKSFGFLEVKNEFVPNMHRFFITHVFLFAFARCPPFTLRDAVHTSIEDAQGVEGRLLLRNYAPEGVRSDDVLPSGTHFALLEPFATSGSGPDDPQPQLRCDNPQNVVCFRSVTEWRAAANGGPADPHGPDAAGQSAADAAAKAAALALACRCRAAAAAYGDALRALGAVDAGAAGLLIARAMCRVRLGEWSAAAADFEAALEADPAAAEATLGLGEALLMQQKPEQALPLVQRLCDEGDDDVATAVLLDDIRRALEERRRGMYDFVQMEREAAAAGGCLSRAHADFVSPALELGVAIVGKGRGARATQAIAENELLMASKAFAVALGRPPDAPPPDVVPSVVHALLANPETAAALYHLDAGPAYRDAPAPTAVESVVDVVRIANICARNSFELQPDPWRAAAAQREGRAGSGRAAGKGLWLREAMLNHSCVPNCQWFQIGDFQFTFAARAIAAGEELCIDYGAAESFAARRAALARFGGDGFACTCPRCAWIAARPDVADIDAEVARAHALLGGAATADAIDEALPPQRRAEIRTALEGLPPEQQPPLDRVLRLDAAVLEQRGHYREALAAYRAAAAVARAARPGALDYMAFTDRCCVVRALLLCGELSAAVRMLQETFRTCCAPFARSAAGFEALVRGQCNPVAEGPERAQFDLLLRTMIKSPELFFAEAQEGAGDALHSGCDVDA